jgi:hypothetical protein
MSERILRVIDLAIGQRDYSMPVERKKFVRRVFEVLADFAHAPLGAHGRTAQESDLPLDMSELSVIHDRELYAWDEHQILMCAGTIDVLRAAFRSQDAAIEASVNAGSMGVETTLDAAIDAIRPKVDELVSNVSAASIDYARSKTFGAYVGKTEELGAQVSPSAEPVGRTL